MPQKARKVSLLCLILSAVAACAPPPPDTASEWYFAKRSEFSGLQHALAATDLRNWDGSPREDRSLSLSLFPTGFNVFFAGRETLEEAEQEALSSCNQSYGSNACYIYYSNANYVRYARREMWLQSNSSARRMIASEQTRAEERRRQTAARSAAQVVVAPAQNGPTAADYDSAEELFGIARDAYESTLPRQPQRCTTMWNGIAWVTQC